MIAPEQLEFSRSVEGLFQKGLGSAVDLALKAKLKAQGLDLDKKLLPGYPAADFHRWVETTARHLYPDLTTLEGTRLLGRTAVPGLEDTMMGRALVSGLKLIGPRRSLERVERVFRNNSNYQRVTVDSLSETGGRITIGFVFGIPGYYQGIFESVMPLLGVRNPRVAMLPTPPPSCQYELGWDL